MLAFGCSRRAMEWISKPKDDNLNLYLNLYSTVVRRTGRVPNWTKKPPEPRLSIDLHVQRTSIFRRMNVERKVKLCATGRRGRHMGDGNRPRTDAIRLNC